MSLNSLNYSSCSRYSENELAAKRFLHKFHEFTKNTYDVAIKWVTRKVKSLFSLKDKSPYHSCVIYEGICNRGENYIGETIRNASVRWNEHEDPKKDSEPAEHLRVNKENKFEWKI